MPPHGTTHLSAVLIQSTMDGWTPPQPVLERIGYRVVRWEKGFVEARFEHTEFAVRKGGTLHGGIIVMALDTTMSMAVVAAKGGGDQVTVELKVNFLEPGRSGPYTVTGHVLRCGKTLAVAEGEVREGDRIIAVGLGTHYLLP